MKLTDEQLERLAEESDFQPNAVAFAVAHEGSIEAGMALLARLADEMDGPGVGGGKTDAHE